METEGDIFAPCGSHIRRIITRYHSSSPFPRNFEFCGFCSSRWESLFHFFVTIISFPIESFVLVICFVSYHKHKHKHKASSVSITPSVSKKMSF